MKEKYAVYREQLPEAFSAKYKNTEETEKKRFHLHRQMEIVIPLSDNMYCRTESRELPIPFGSILLISSMNLHYLVSRKGSGTCRRFVIYFSPEFVDGLSTSRVNLLECFLMNPTDEPRVMDIPGDMRREIYAIARRLAGGNVEDTEGERAEDPAGERTEGTAEMQETPMAMRHPGFLEMEQRLLLGELLLHISEIRQRGLPDKGTALSSEHSRMVFDICEYVRQHFDQEITLDDVAERFFVSRTQLFYIFREVLGITLKEYIIQYRLMKAKDMLINTSLSVERISELTGYTLHSFSRVFAARVGVSPLRYRKLHRSGTTND